MTRVYADMVADLFHFGHVEFLRKVSALGDFVLIGIHADDVVESYKRKPILTMEERMSCVAGCRYVDEVVPNAPLQVSSEWIEQNGIELVVHGDDMSEEQLKSLYQIPIDMGILRTVPYTTSISTTEIIRRCKEAKP
jgi:cytidyltransferase-like protein